MELRDFISGTLTQIIDGVKEAQEHADSSNSKVNPDKTLLIGDEPGFTLKSSGDVPYAQIIEFDVAVTTYEGDNVNVGAGIFVGGLGLGAKGQTEISSSAISRIKFSVPVFLPKH